MDRVARPMSRGSLSEPRTAGMIFASQASIRACRAVIWVTSSMQADPSPEVRDSRGMVTTMVVRSPDRVGALSLVMA
ncbi:hypothetical protein BB31_40230 [Amycolatopsis lurida NRRL 2430]|uniref:Uncharacterized protein n=1 Tax=Amycolatopsis lurida NRRL 2430 TaxID=1460371 RepID=A0A2P2FG68_AMYLU|nr:hypothetical protein BB31_40230 [Amycolatopsis lurida NRRL 2430]